jgi:hypothetical protein
MLVASRNAEFMHLGYALAAEAGSIVILGMAGSSEIEVVRMLVNAQ